jgi:hypothetical protein
MPARIMPADDSIERKKNREYRVATLGAHPSFRSFLAICVQNSLFTCTTSIMVGLYV